ncbi:MAG: hypothetical protein ACLFU4_03505 [Opitutales bacterium]
MKNAKKLLGPLIGLLALSSLWADKPMTPSPLDKDDPIRGWMILSDRLEEGLEVIRRSPEYDINHLQISHHLVHSLEHVRDPRRRKLAQALTEAAHAAGIREVTLWDRVLHHLDYYPEEFRTGPGGTLDLDNPDFWEWFKEDYREKLDLVPDIQGLILTFIETGARAERQHSETLTTNQQKLAAVVNAVAEVVIEERGLNLYARTFAYTYEEYDNIVGAVELFENDDIRLMMKETPHDFLLTHPNDFFAGTIDRPTLMEFDPAAEFNGQGILANTWPQHILERWSDFLERDNIVGYVARTDRYGDTRIIGRPSEINLWALKRYFEDRSVTADTVYREFITSHYGEAAYSRVRGAFENAFDIITSSLYTLGTNVADHSQLNHAPYSSSYARHVSGKWMDPPVAKVEHGVYQTFHYWKDVINAIAPQWAKAGGTQLHEIPWVVEAGWLEPGEQMSEAIYRAILTQKAYSVELAEEALRHINAAKQVLSDENAHQLFHTFNRTLYTARLYEAVSRAYYGFRLYARGEAYRSDFVMQQTRKGLEDIRTLCDAIEAYPEPGPTGQYHWVRDTEKARDYYEWITEGTWPAKMNGFSTGLDGVQFPLEEPES